MSTPTSDLDVAVTPQFAVPTAHEAVARVNRWLHGAIGTAVHAAAATFDPATFYWHVPIELAYGATGPLGVVGDVYVHAATLTLLVGAIPSQTGGAPPVEVHGTEPPLAYVEVLDFLLARPTPHDILAFKVSDAAQARLRLLLDKNREEALSTTEEAELDIYEQLEHLMLLLKAKAYALVSRP